jgi:hypothetical protein
VKPFWEQVHKAVTKSEGLNNFLAAPKMVSFLTAGSWEKDTIFGAARKFSALFILWRL